MTVSKLHAGIACVAAVAIGALVIGLPGRRPAPPTGREPVESHQADPGRAAAAPALTTLAGTWHVVSAEEKGKAVPPETIEDSTLTVDDGGVAEFKGITGLGRCRVRMNPEADPKEIDVTPEAGPHAGVEVRGIYAAIPGEKVRVCLRLPTTPKEWPRPKGFLTNSGAGLYTITLERR